MTLLKAIALSIFGLKRIARSRALVAMLVGLPVACGIAGASGGSVMRPALVWVGPLLCAALVAGVLAVQRSVDNTTSLSAALAGSPLGPSGLALSRVAAGIALFVPQMLILAVMMKCVG